MRGRFLLAILGLLLGLAPAHANYWEGHEAFRRGDYYTAHKEFLRLAKLGHAAAQFNLAYLYHHGLAVPRDPVEAAKWYREAAGQGRVEAQFSLGTLYETGVGVSRDPVQAYRWYNLAASNVPPGPSRDRLIRHRARVSGQLSADQLRAVEAAPAPAGFALAANLTAPYEPARATPSVADIQRELAARSFNPGAIDGEMGRSTVGALSAFQASIGLEVTGEPDLPTLAKLFGPEDVAPHLEPFPRPVLVRTEPTPPAVPVPPVEAVQLDPDEPAVTVAAAPSEDTAVPAPEPPAQPVVPPAPARATQPSEAAAQGPEDDAVVDDPDTLRRLAEQGDASAQIALATLYHYGQGVQENHAEALKWYGRAARQGRVDALFPLGSLYESRAGGPQDLVEAHRWYSLAADLVPAGKAREIIVQRRDRVAEQLPSVPANRPPSEIVFTLPNGASSSSVKVAETAAGGTVLGTVGASDPDAGNVLAFALSEDSAGRFAIDPASGVLTVAGDARLDFETTPRFELVVTATDGEGLSARAPVTVSLADDNEPPRALRLAVGGTVAEHAPAGTVVGRVEASDPDAGDRLAYSLVEDAGGRFAIDPETGTLRVAEGASFDFEQVTHRFAIDPDSGLIVPSSGRHFDPQSALGHRLVVRATDSGGLSTDAAFAIRVIDSNEKPWLEASAFTVEENAAGGTLVGRIRAGDPDGGMNGELRYAVTGGDSDGRFAIDARTGEIAVAEGAQLDFETDPVFQLTVTVTDGGGLSDDALIGVALLDGNEPPAVLGVTGGAVAEHAEGGTVAARLLAGDPDAGDRVTFSLTGDAGGRFVIDSTTGVIAVAEGADLDFDRAASHEIVVRVTDSGGLGATEKLTINVTDENLAPTAIAVSDGTVAENAEAGTLVATISANDPDAGERLAYSLSEDAGGRFAIDAESGRITVSAGAQFDYEREPRHQLRVRVVDSGGLAYEEALSIAVVDFNEAPRLAAASFLLDEIAGAGETVGRVQASDPDRGDNGRLRYSIARDDSGGRFTLDPATGVLTVAEDADLDFESRRHYELEVAATDAAGLDDRATVAIALVDKNEAPAAKSERLVVSENAGAGTVAGRVDAADPDAGDRLAYTLIDDADGRFAIDPETGAIRVAEGAGLDFETSSGFEVIARVTDGGGLGDTVVLPIGLADLNEAPSASVAIAGMVAENARPGTLAAAVTASDPDAGDRLTYSLTEDAGGRFVIDAGTGLITVAHDANLDFERTPELEVTVRVTDSGGLTSEQDLTIALLDVDEAPASKEELFVLQGAGPNGSAANGSDLNARGAADGKLDGRDADAPQPLNRVAAVQAQLIEAGFDPGPVDGKLGPRTRAALSEYRQAFRLTDLQDADLLDHLLVRAHFRRGYKLQVRGDYGASIAEYSEVLRIDPDHFSAYFNRGLIHYTENRYDRAIEDFDKVIGLRPDYAGAYVNRGNAYYRQGLYASAARDYLKAAGIWLMPW